MVKSNKPKSKPKSKKRKGDEVPDPW
jgi:hypothetical protein